jgi:flagellar assembly factor FliW
VSGEEQGGSTQDEGGAMGVTDAFDGLPIVEIPEGIVGFPELTKYVLVSLDEEGMVFDLRSVEDERIRFVVVPSLPFFPDYQPEIDDEFAAQYSINDASDALVLLVVTLGASMADCTANLMAPIVLNPQKRIAAQIVLDNPDFSVRVPLSAA